VCGSSARTDLCERRSAMIVPTATARLSTKLLSTKLSRNSPREEMIDPNREDVNAEDDGTENESSEDDVHMKKSFYMHTEVRPSDLLYFCSE
jgi:hypothetical protein